MASSPTPDYRAAPHSPPPPRKRKRLLYERRVLLVSIVAALPGTAACAILLFSSPMAIATRVSVLTLVLITQAVLIFVLHDQIIRPLQTLTNVVSALREEDYSFRARGAAPNDALGELAIEINSLADLLAEQRTRTIEATALLRRVVEVVDVPLFAFDPEGRLRLVNSAGEKLCQKPASALMGRLASEIDAAACFDAEDGAQIVLPQTPNSRWLIRRSQFRQAGVPHTLIVLSDVSRALRDEERSAWQRLIRVLGHELNNSLAPIKSIAGTLSMRVLHMQMSDSERGDFTRGLGIIESRAASLNRFLQAYRRLASIPSPSLRAVDVHPLISRIASLESRVHVKVNGGPPVTALLDPDQIEQMMINLIKNAAEASLQDSAGNGAPEVDVSWNTADSRLLIYVTDNGPGLLNPDNVFVPFYTTKAEGSGIGLVLSRQIAESHSGSINLSNRTDGRGCVATVTLPL